MDNTPLIHAIQERRVINRNLAYTHLPLLNSKFAFKMIDKNNIYLLGYNREVDGNFYYYPLEEVELIELNSSILNEILLYIEKIIAKK